MSINIRQKGANGEREIATAMNAMIGVAMTELGYPQEAIDKASGAVQRNQNQSAVGGNDLSNTLGMSIEVKRQEQLSVNTWWKQCTEAAKRNAEWPVLIYRQNHGKWRVVTYVRTCQHDMVSSVMVRAEMDWDAFQFWFKDWVMHRLKQGYQLKI